MSNHKASWSTLYTKAQEALDESRVVVGVDNFYRAQTMREVLEWMEELEAGTTVIPSQEPAARLVCGTGTDEQGSYEVVRRVRAKEYRVEREDGSWHKVSLTGAVDWVQEPQLGQAGLSAFDKMYADKLPQAS